MVSVLRACFHLAKGDFHTMDVGIKFGLQSIQVFQAEYGS